MFDIIPRNRKVHEQFQPERAFFDRSGGGKTVSRVVEESEVALLKMANIKFFISTLNLPVGSLVSCNEAVGRDARNDLRSTTLRHLYVCVFGLLYSVLILWGFL